MLDVSKITPDTARPLRRVEYERMVEVGLFAEERLELIEGVIVTMSPQGSRHAAAVRKLNQHLTLAMAGRALVQVQSPLALDSYSLPEPNLAVVPLGDYDRQHPDAALLVVEVAESTLQKDRMIKAPLYAAASIHEYWIVNLEHDRVEVQRDPRSGVYATQLQRRRGEIIELSAFPDVVIAVDDILPR